MSLRKEHSPWKNEKRAEYQNWFFLNIGYNNIRKVLASDTAMPALFISKR